MKGTRFIPPLHGDTRPGLIIWSLAPAAPDRARWPAAECPDICVYRTGLSELYYTITCSGGQNRWQRLSTRTPPRSFTPLLSQRHSDVS
ncbi:hypothetical protein CDAR_26641 [Caerostris darwini]|uniref:Uncharacterized protein n=1 Tax=Caerostris darwini TaxID=1538125 RepID=A0AAV4P4A9_9ARAC|nr:hypothetical protein CDAR_26641 [Caerostris darwini]